MTVEETILDALGIKVGDMMEVDSTEGLLLGEVTAIRVSIGKDDPERENIKSFKVFEKKLKVGIK